MKTKLIKIGAALCVRLPKDWLKQVGISDEVELEVRGSAIIVRPIRQTRQGWAAAFRTATTNNKEPDEFATKR